MSQRNELFSNIFGQGSRQLVPAHIKVSALSPAQIVGDASRQLVRIHIEVLNGSNPVDTSTVRFEFGGDASRQSVVTQMKPDEFVEISDRFGWNSCTLICNVCLIS